MKIAESKNEDWSKGISAQGNIPIGGLFQQMKGVDPFYNQGLVVPSFTPSTITPSSTPKFITNFNTGGVAYTYWHSDTEIKQTLKDSPYTQVDKSSFITFTLPVMGAIIWADIATGTSKYIYARAGGSLRAVPVPLAAGDIEIKAGFNSTPDDMPLCIGADGNLYHGDNSRVGIITSGAGTAGNAGFFSIDGNFQVRDLINDGTYLVVLADNNTQTTAGRQVGNYRCKIYFWDMKKSLADYIYEVQDSYLIAGKQLDGSIYFFGYNGLYICNAGTPPKLIRPFAGFNGLSVAKPTTSYQLIKNKGSLLWIDGLNSVLTNGNIYAYGNPTTGQHKIFYTPHLNANTSSLQTVLQVVGDQYWVANASPTIYVHNIGSTNGTATITFLDKVMPQPHKFDFVKVVLSAPLASGQSVSCLVTGQNGGKTISATETKSYSASNPRQQLIFKVNPSTNSENRFEDIRVTITSVGASLQRVAIFATPLEDSTEII